MPRNGFLRSLIQESDPYEPKSKNSEDPDGFGHRAYLGQFPDTLCLIRQRSLWWAKTFNSGFAAMGIPFQFDGDAVLRKLAHATEYALLGVMAALYFHESGKLLKSCGRHHLLYIGFTAAFLDETIQLFVPGRSGQIADVWIDLAGFLPAMGIVMLVTKKKGTD